MTDPSLNQELEHFLLSNGRPYKPALLPDDIERGRMGHCFDNALITAMRSGGRYTYVEGLAWNPRHGCWMLHAWLTDGEYAFDPTWYALDNRTGKEAPFPTVYIGIEMEARKVADFVMETEYAGVVVNAWRNPTLARACAPGIPTEKA